MKLLQLLVDNKRTQARSKVVVSAKADEPSHVYLYDAIVSDKWMAEYFGGVLAQDLVVELHAIKGDVVLHINSPGGDVFGMQAIMSALRNMKGKVTAIIEGLAASAATGIASVADEVVMEVGALYMIHNSHGMAYGDKNELRSLADTMDKVDAGMVDAYVAKSGKPAAEVQAWMDAETWFNAQEAVDAGFADRVNEPTKDKKGAAAKAASEWKLTAYQHAPQIVVPAEPEPKPEPVVVPPVPEAITDEEHDRLRLRLRRATVLGRDPSTSATRAV